MNRRDELRKRREERREDQRRRERRALVCIGVAFVVAIVLALTIRLVSEAFGAETTPDSGRDVASGLDDERALQAEHARNAALLRRVRRQARTIRRQRRNFRYALHASTVGDDWLERAFLCIYRYEHGANGWRTNTANGYDGGLQMDRSFQRTHGARYLAAFGTADRWPRSVQIAVGIHAWTTRGFQPWPNTARECGLR